MLSASPLTEDGITWPPESLSGFIPENAMPHTLFLILFRLYSFKSNVEHPPYGTCPAKY